MICSKLKLDSSESKWVDEMVDRVLSDDRVEGLLLFGSWARAEAEPDSDLDLLVVHRNRAPDDLLDRLSDRVSLSFRRAEHLAVLSERSPLFANHLAREGIILRDSNGALADILEQVESITPSVGDRLLAKTARRCGVVLRDPSFRVSDRLSAAELFALSKQVAFLHDALIGKYEFNRHRAFADLGEADPRLWPDVENVMKLEPAWLASRLPAPLSAESVAVTTEVVRSISRILRSVAER